MTENWRCGLSANNDLTKESDEGCGAWGREPTIMNMLNASATLPFFDRGSEPARRDVCDSRYHPEVKSFVPQDRGFLLGLSVLALCFW